MKNYGIYYGICYGKYYGKYYNTYTIDFCLETLYLKAYSDFKILDNYLILPYKII